MPAATTAPTASGGYWTIQVVNRDRDEIGRRYVCHAQDDAGARSIAGLLAGSATAVVGYDYHRIDNPHGRYARDLDIGRYEPVDDAETWAVLQSARRSA